MHDRVLNKYNKRPRDEKNTDKGWSKGKKRYVWG